MKQYISTFLTLIAIGSVSFAQAPLYIQFDPGCVNQLEYKYTYKGQNLLMYSVAKGENELYFFVIADKEPAISVEAPRGTVFCNSDEINATSIENINAGGRLAYIVFKEQKGFLTFQVESAGYIARSGTYFSFRTTNYDFVVDTSSINYARNLSRPGVSSPVYITGRRSQDCLQLYAFRLEPAQPDAPRADVEVIPGIGVISNRTGRNGSEMEQNVYSLVKVNGISLDDYTYAVCHKNDENESGTFITNLPPDANPNNAFKVENPFTEPDKESYYTQPSSPDKKVQLAKCPTPPGYGYHIVQPGDSLKSIARLYNVSEASLMQWNNLKDVKQIKVCDKIWITSQGTTAIPAPEAGYHVVQKGETLFSIARKYNITVANIKQWNNLKNDQIQLGQKLMVTSRSIPVEYTSPQTVEYTSPQTSNSPNVYSYSPPPGPDGSQTGKMIYKVQSGESLNDVAWKYGYTTPYLRYINRNTKNLPPGNQDKLPEGFILVVSDTKGIREDLSSFIPPAQYSQAAPPIVIPSVEKTDAPPATFASPLYNAPTYEYVGEYIVKDGDTLASIAQQYSLTPEKLAAANNLKPGQKPLPRSILKIPK